MQRGMNALRSLEAKGKPPLLCRIFYYAFYTRGLFRSEGSTGTALCRLCRQVQKSDHHQLGSLI